MKVWILTTGSYSDYRIVAVCSTKAEAERVDALAGCDSIEEWEIPAKNLVLIFRLEICQVPK